MTDNNNRLDVADSYLDYAIEGLEQAIKSLHDGIGLVVLNDAVVDLKRAKIKVNDARESVELFERYDKRHNLDQQA